MNALCLCFTCHADFTANPLDFEAWVRGYIGQGQIDLLNEQRRPQFKTTKQVLKDIAKFYREQLKTLQPGDKLISYH